MKLVIEIYPVRDTRSKSGFTLMMLDQKIEKYGELTFGLIEGDHPTSAKKRKIEVLRNALAGIEDTLAEINLKTRAIPEDPSGASQTDSPS